MADAQEQQRENVPSQPPRDGGEKPHQQQQQQQPGINPLPPKHPDDQPSPR